MAAEAQPGMAAADLKRGIAELAQRFEDRVQALFGEYRTQLDQLVAQHLRAQARREQELRDQLDALRAQSAGVAAPLAGAGEHDRVLERSGKRFRVRFAPMVELAESQASISDTSAAGDSQLGAPAPAASARARQRQEKLYGIEVISLDAGSTFEDELGDLGEDAEADTATPPRKQDRHSGLLEAEDSFRFQGSSPRGFGSSLDLPPPLESAPVAVSMSAPSSAASTTSAAPPAVRRPRSLNNRKRRSTSPLNGHTALRSSPPESAWQPPNTQRPAEAAATVAMEPNKRRRCSTGLGGEPGGARMVDTQENLLSLLGGTDPFEGLDVDSEFPPAAPKRAPGKQRSRSPLPPASPPRASSSSSSSSTSATTTTSSTALSSAARGTRKGQPGSSLANPGPPAGHREVISISGSPELGPASLVGEDDPDDDRLVLSPSPPQPRAANSAPASSARPRPVVVRQLPDAARPDFEVVRNKELREQMTAVACPECERWYTAISGDPEKARTMCQHAGRHRFWRPPASTPEGYWDISSPATPVLSQEAARKADTRSPQVPAAPAASTSSSAAGVAADLVSAAHTSGSAARLVATASAPNPAIGTPHAAAPDDTQEPPPAAAAAARITSAARVPAQLWSPAPGSLSPQEPDHDDDDQVSPVIARSGGRRGPDDGSGYVESPVLNESPAFHPSPYRERPGTVRAPSPAGNTGSDTARLEDASDPTAVVYGSIQDDFDSQASLVYDS